ncbi:MAG: hypothetical protein GWO86_02685 [Planctomycetes bacterium]|nr:hypothetical protein [Planctomycetota bacterium]
MKKQRRNIIPFICIAAAILIIIALQRHFSIRNFHVIEPDILYTSGQPRGMDYTRLLYKYHIGTFINLRSEDEHRDHNWYNEEIIWMRNNGANYVNLPVNKYGRAKGFPDEETQKKFLEIMADKSNLPILIHDSSGEERSPRLAAVWMIKSGKYSLDDTIKKVAKIKKNALTAEEIEFLNTIH